MLYAFILGRKHRLSIAELTAMLMPQDHIVDISPEALIVDLKDGLESATQTINRLGGTIKIGRVFAELPLTEENFTTPIFNHLSALPGDSKIIYGISTYSFADRSKIIVKNLLNNLKKRFKEAERSSRYLNKGLSNLANAAIAGENLIEKGAEILVIQGKHKTFIAQTEAIQDFENYSKRDYDRPERDAKLGMLPPKLAQIMINLAGFSNLNNLPQEKNIYDPFVGLGTVLAEAMLMGFNAIGSDLQPEVLKKAQTNMDWLQKEFEPIGQPLDLFTKDATTITQKDLMAPVHAVVTESYLGPPMKHEPHANEIKKNFKHIEELITRFFRTLSNFLPKGTPVVISFPSYRIDKQNISLDELPIHIKELGFNAEPLITKQVQVKWDVAVNDYLFYDREQQIVARQIWKFIKS